MRPELTTEALFQSREEAREDAELIGHMQDALDALRPSESEERKALMWLTDLRANGGPVDREYAASVIRTLAWFERNAPGHQHHRARDGRQA